MCYWGEGEGGHTLHPILHMLDILLGILQILQHMLRIRVEEARLRRLARFDRHGPAAVLDSSCEVAFECVLSIHISIDTSV